jgi:hypothetical protein
MRWSRQLTWLCLAGGLLSASVAVAATVGPQSARRHPIPVSGYQGVAFSVPSILADPLDDDDGDDVQGRARLAPIVQRSAVEAAWPEPAPPRAPVTTCNRPAPRRLKVPAPSGDDVPIA